MSEPKIKDIDLESKTEREDLEEKSVTANGLLCSAASEPLKTALGMSHSQWITTYSVFFSILSIFWKNMFNKKFIEMKHILAVVWIPIILFTVITGKIISGFLFFKKK